MMVTPNMRELYCFWRSSSSAAAKTPPTNPTPSGATAGPGRGQVVYPRAIACDPVDDSFFIIDRLARVQHLDHDGKFLGEWRMPEWGIGKPVGVAVGPDGNIYVPDTHYHRVMVYSPQGKFLRTWGSEGRERGQFIYPTDLAWDSKGHLFVSEYGDNDRVQVFDPSINPPKLLYQFGKFGSGPGEFSRPQSMVIDHDLVYITDACNHRIAVFKADGIASCVQSRIGRIRAWAIPVSLRIG